MKTIDQPYIGHVLPVDAHVLHIIVHFENRVRVHAYKKGLQNALKQKLSQYDAPLFLGPNIRLNSAARIELVSANKSAEKKRISLGWVACRSANLIYSSSSVHITLAKAEINECPFWRALFSPAVLIKINNIRIAHGVLWCSCRGLRKTNAPNPPTTTHTKRRMCMCAGVCSYTIHRHTLVHMVCLPCLEPIFTHKMCYRELAHLIWAHTHKRTATQKLRISRCSHTSIYANVNRCR